MSNALRIGVVFGLILTAVNGSLELLPAAFANLVGVASIATWLLCVGLAGVTTRRRFPQSSAAVAAMIVVAVDTTRSALVKMVTGATAMLPSATGPSQAVHMTPGMIVLVNLLIFLLLAPVAAGIGSLSGRLARVRQAI